MNWQKAINEIVNFLLSPEFSGWLLIVKYTFLFFGLFFLAFLIWFFLKTSWLHEIFFRDLKEFLSYKPFYLKKFSPKWKKIEKRLESKIEADLKLAILEADDLLKEGLDLLGYPGETLEEKLEKITEEVIPNLKELISARQVKKDIIEDPSFKLSLEEAKKTLSIYERALKDLQIL